MKRYNLTLWASLALLSSIAVLNAQEAPADPMAGHAAGGGMPMGHGTMMHHGMMGPGTMMQPAMMRMMIVILDTNGDGKLSLEELQSAHARMFKAMDADKDGGLTAEEVQTFMRGQ